MMVVMIFELAAVGPTTSWWILLKFLLHAGLPRRGLG